jgi:type III restriction enzyme
LKIQKIIKQFYVNERENEIEVFIYESGQIASVKRFIGTDHLSVLVMTPSSFDKDSNVLNRPLENEIYASNLFVNNLYPPKSYLDCLKRLNPIVIMDEPHRFSGDAFKKYFEGFDNYYLRFGATFPKNKNNNDTTIPLSNVAYILDSISSFRQNLVKKIVVYTQDVVQNNDTLIDIENKKAIVNTLTNGIVVKRELGIGEIFNNNSINKINKNNIVLNDGSIEKVDYSLSDDALRSMIKETIKIHFEKEQVLFEHGIKALSLFFIESNIELYRGSNPKIKKIFEEEYIKQRIKIVESLQSTFPNTYYQYLQNDFDSTGNLLVNEGYFSGDKGSGDEKIKTGVDLILKNKKELLSFKNPTRFIFSIWALQEGWDNPNVFTICKLSNHGSENSKLQQIGRGLRICVDQNLKRHTIKDFDDNQDEFWKVNNLDVVVSNHELGFVEAIQNEILNNSFLVGDTFTEQDLLKILKEKSNFDDNTIINIVDNILKEKKMIVHKTIIDGQRIYEKSADFAVILKVQDLPEEQRKALESIFVSDYKNFVQDKNKIRPKKNLVIKSQYLAEFQKLWNTINQNSFYMIDNLDEESEKNLIKNIKTEIETLNIEEILMQTVSRELNINKIGQSAAITAQVKEVVSYQSKVDYLQFVKDLSKKSKTHISFIIKIFNDLSSDFKNKILVNNPTQALKEMTEIVSTNLVSTIKTRIHYNEIDGAVLPNVFLSANNETYLKTGSTGKFQKNIDRDFSLKEKWIFKDVIEYDSNFEVEIIEQDHDLREIEFFGKLPKLKIKTPLGEYNPDFCYAVKSNAGNKIILIVESKGYETSTSIPQDEKGKIEFAKKHFEHLNEHYKNQDIKISFRERINNTQLASLIYQSI